jgi:hypothetical protein
MGACSLGLGVHAVGMYLYAERLLAKAGGSKGKGRGIAHPEGGCRPGCTECPGDPGAFSARWGGERRKPGETPGPREGAAHPERV